MIYVTLDQVEAMTLADKIVVETKIKLPANGEKVLVGLRPQHLTVKPGPSGIKLDIRERLGGVSYDYLDTPQGERLIVETRNDVMIEEGTPVNVTLDPANALFYYAMTEKRLR